MPELIVEKISTTYLNVYILKKISKNRVDSASRDQSYREFYVDKSLMFRTFGADLRRYCSKWQQMRRAKKEKLTRRMRKGSPYLRRLLTKKHVAVSGTLISML